MIRSLVTLGVVAVLVCAAGMPLAGQGTGYLKAKVDPGRAGVFVDGKYLGPVANFGMSRKYQVAAGEHEIRLVDPRYEEWIGKVTVASGKTATITESLKALPLAKPPFGTLRVQCADKFAAVYINDRFYGHAGEFNNPTQGLLLNPGSYEVRVEPTAGGKPSSEKVTIAADQTAIVRAAM
ncbi:MAG: PEGA domain-containing protein [Bryobacteraceae bacterium]